MTPTNNKLSKKLRKHGHFAMADEADELERVADYWKQNSEEAQAELHKLMQRFDEQNKTIEELLELKVKLVKAEASISVAREEMEGVALMRKYAARDKQRRIDLASLMPRALAEKLADDVMTLGPCWTHTDVKKRILLNDETPPTDDFCTAVRSVLEQ